MASVPKGASGHMTLLIFREFFYYRCFEEILSQPVRTVPGNLGSDLVLNVFADLNGEFIVISLVIGLEYEYVIRVVCKSLHYRIRKC